MECIKYVLATECCPNPADDVTYIARNTCEGAVGLTDLEMAKAVGMLNEHAELKTRVTELEAENTRLRAQSKPVETWMRPNEGYDDGDG